MQTCIPSGICALKLMQLTQFTDYALRTLVYLHHRQASGARTSIAEIADYYGVSRHHLIRVAGRLRDHGYIRMIRGRNGGLELAMAAEDIIIGRVVRQTEPDFHLVECFDQAHDHCVISRQCQLKSALYQARSAFLEVLDRYSLATAGMIGLMPNAQMPAPSAKTSLRNMA